MNTTAIAIFLILFVLVISAILVVVILLIIKKCSKKKNNRPIEVKRIEINNQETKQATTLQSKPYGKSKRFLSDAELSFYKVIQFYLKEKAVVCPKIGLKEFIYIKRASQKDHTIALNRIARKHIDFLICNNETMEILCGVELDDNSHNRKSRVIRDNFVDDLYRDIGLKIVHIKAKLSYTQEDIKPILDIISKGE